MSRLTARTKTTKRAACNAVKCADTCEKCEHMDKMMEKLADYEDKQEQGLLIELPCKVGDTLYRIWTCGKSGRSIAEFKIEHIDIDNYPQIEFSYRCTKDSHSFYPYRFCKLEDLGKTVFLTRSEAEEALAKMGGK